MRILFIFILFVNVVWGQQIDNRQCGAYTDLPFFNVQFIKQNKIKSMNGSISFKKELDIIREQSLVEIFQFDADGHQYSTFNTYKEFGAAEDSAIVYFEYQNDLLITKRKSDTYGFFSDNYEYDSLGRVSKKTYCRDENANSSKFDFQLKKQFTIVSEEYTYSGEEGKILTKKYFNNYKRPFKSEEFIWDKNGYLTEESSRTVIGNKRSKISYSYNENGQVSTKIEIPDVDGSRTIKNEYVYDDLGNLTEHNYYKNDRHITYRKLLYNAKTMLLESQLSKDISSGTITITKYSYEFYP